MPILKIITIPNEILRQKAKVVNFKTADKKNLRRLAKNMIATMRQAQGIGLAAPQVNQSIRLIVVEQTADPVILVNPVIKRFSWRKEMGIEGCLSVPGQSGDVKRSINISVEGQNINGEKIKFKAKGLFARVIQHEVDHLNGILFIDRIKKMKE